MTETILFFAPGSKMRTRRVRGALPRRFPTERPWSKDAG